MDFLLLLLVVTSALGLTGPRCHVEASNATSPDSAQPLSQCDLSAGRWVRNPFVKRYTGYSCQSIRSQLNCDRNGRPDSEYLNYEWKAPGCSIKRHHSPPSPSLVLLSSLPQVQTPQPSSERTSSAFGTGVKASGFSVPSHNFLFLRQSTNFLVDSEPQGSASSKGVWTVRLWQADPKWAKLIPHVNYVLFATGHWFTNAPSNTRDYRDNNGKQISINSMRAMRTAIRTVRQTIQSTNFRGMPLFLSYTATHYQKSFPPQDSMNDCMGAKSPVGNNVVAYAEKNTFFMQARNQLRSSAARVRRPLLPSFLNVTVTYCHLPFPIAVPSPLTLLACRPFVPSCRSLLPAPLAPPLNPDVFLDSIVSIGPPLTFPLPESHRARWIYTPRLAPQYTAESCKSLGRNFACQRNGRPDSEYEKYTWRSFGCTIAEFKPLSFLTLLRNKVFLVVGDSLTMNLFSSLQCLVETVATTEVTTRYSHNHSK
ncbi:unnamed protein product [Closterium sp. NIES-65]|nr:unnamed protein product [Closterium sp. NIES-65]